MAQKIDPYQYFNLSCPAGGSPYICNVSETPFLGCCASNACAHKDICPTDDLYPISHGGGAANETLYNVLPTQDCSIPRGIPVFWVCVTPVPNFYGCCLSNPCYQGSCPRSDLVPAKLSDDPTKRAKFLSPGSQPLNSTGASAPSTSISDPSSPPSSSSASAQSTGSSQSMQNSSSGLSASSIAGAAVGSVIGTFAILALLLIAWRKRSRGKARGVAYQPAGGRHELGLGEAVNASKHMAEAPPDHEVYEMDAADSRPGELPGLVNPHELPEAAQRDEGD